MRRAPHNPAPRAGRVGIISDTHGLLRPQALAFLEASDLIIHAGDVCEPQVLDALRCIAPVTCVRGNNDRGTWAASLPLTDMVRVGDVYLYVVHDIADLDVDPVAAGVRVVISGHSHQPAIEHRDGVTYVNPGSAGPRRFKLPISVAEVVIAGDTVSARCVELAG